MKNMGREKIKRKISSHSALESVALGPMLLMSKSEGRGCIPGCDGGNVKLGSERCGYVHKPQHCWSRGKGDGPGGGEHLSDPGLSP